MLADLHRDLGQRAKPEKALLLSHYFQAKKAGYGEGAQFLGVAVPDQRQIALAYKQLSLRGSEELVRSPFHEERLTALFILVRQFTKGSLETKKAIYELYMRNLRYVNNWDLVDSSAPYICGPYLFNKDKAILYALARSQNLWERRVAMLSVGYFIRQHEYTDALAIAELLVHDPEDLIHKAVGWMLREIGNRQRSVEEQFLDKYYNQIPRTMLRYAIEKFPPARKAHYMKKIKSSPL